MSEKKEILDKVAVMLAFAEGKRIEYAYKSPDNWQENRDPVWNFGAYKYRVKPEPPRKFVRYYVIDPRNPDSLGTAFINKESAKKKCCVLNVYAQKEVYSIVAFEMTEIKENAA